MYGNYRQVSGKIGSVVFKTWSTSKSHLPDFFFFLMFCSITLLTLCTHLLLPCVPKWNPVIMLQFSSNHLLFGIPPPPKNSSMFLESSCLDFFLFFKPPFSLSTFITACWSSKTMCLLKTFYSQLLPLYHHRGEKSLNAEGFFSFLKNLCKDIFKGCFHLMALYSTCHSRDHLTRLLYSF